MCDRVQSFADSQNLIFDYFQSYGLENKSIGVVFRVEFDGDIRFCVAPPKSTFFMIFIDLFEVLRDFFVFGVFVKLLGFFSRRRRRAKNAAAAAVAATAATAAAAAIATTVAIKLVLHMLQ